MTSIKSQELDIQASSQKLFDFLSDFSRFGSLMPPQISEWTSTEESCSFQIQNMAKIALRIKEKNPYSRLIIASEPPSPFAFDLIASFVDTSDHSCRSLLEISADINPMMAMMVKNPLQNFVNILNQKLKEVSE